MKRLFLILLIISLALAACGGDKDEKAAPQEERSAEVAMEAEAPTATPQPPTATPLPPTATPLPPTVAPDASADDSPLSLEQLSALDDLSSYRTYSLFEYSGTDDNGQPVDTRMEFLSEYTREPKARSITMNFSDPLDDDLAEGMGTAQFLEIGDTSYVQFDGQWMQISAQESPLNEPSTELMINSGLLFSDLEGLKRVRPDEKVNGVDSRHYTFDETSLNTIFGLMDGAEVRVQGDVWIAKDGGYVTRYVMEADVKEDGGLLAPDLAQGTLRMEFELRDVNSDFVIEVPQEATSGSALPGFEESGFPRPEGATMVIVSPEFTMMQSSLPVADVRAFYEEALAGLGWTLNEEDSMVFGGFTSLSFTKDGLTLTLTLSDGEDGTQIMVDVEGAP